MLSQYLENLEKRYKNPQESNLGIALRSELANQIVRSEEGGDAYSRLTFINDNRDLTTVELQFDCTGGGGEYGEYEVNWDEGDLYDSEEDYYLNTDYYEFVGIRSALYKARLRLDDPSYSDYKSIEITDNAENEDGGEYEDDYYIEQRTANYPVGFAVYVEGAVREELSDQYRLPFASQNPISKEYKYPEKLRFGSRLHTQNKLFLIVDRNQDYDKLESWAEDYALDFADENEGQKLEIEIITVDPFSGGFLRDPEVSQVGSWYTNIRGIANFLDKNDYVDLDTMYRTQMGRVDLLAILDREVTEYWSWPIDLGEGGQCDITFTVNGSMALGGGRKQAQTVFAFVTREVKHWVETLEPDEIQFSGTSERVRLYERLARMIEESGYDNLTESSGSGIQARLVRV